MSSFSYLCLLCEQCIMSQFTTNAVSEWAVKLASSAVVAVSMCSLLCRKPKHTPSSPPQDDELLSPDLLRRASQVKFRDSRRSLLFLKAWNAACQRCEECVKVFAGDNVVSFNVIKAVAQSWARDLDDFLVPLVVQELTKTRATISTPEQQRLLYQRLFVDEGKMSSWARGVLTDNPMLERLIQGHLDRSVENLSLCFDRLSRDWVTITGKGGLFEGLRKKDLLLIEPTDSDGHCNGQKVLVLQFLSVKVVYKPFGGQAASLYHRFVEMVRSQPGLVHYPRAMQVVAPSQPPSSTGNTYCWAEFVENDSCASASDVVAFYYRAGVVLAIGTALGFTDGHMDNIVACGDSPIIIDCETFFQPFDPTVHNDTEAILRTCLLQEKPHAFSSSSATWLAGFQHPNRYANATHSFAVVKDRTSMISILYGASDSQSESKSIPRLGSAPQYLHEHRNTFLSGFKDAMALLRSPFWEKKTDNSSQYSQWLSEALASTIRIVLRTTSHYILLLRLLQQPATLKSESLASSILSGELQAYGGDKAVLDAELRDLLRFDVPAFYGKAETGEILDSGGKEVLTRSESWCPWEGLVVFNIECAESLASWMEDIIKADPESDLRVDDLSAKECAISMAQEVIVGIFTPGRTLSLPIHNDLYSGLSGVAIFFAALYKHTGSVHLKSATLHLTHSILSQRPVRDRDDSCGGGFWGPAGDCYAIATAGYLLCDEKLILAATKLCVDEITLKSISLDRTYDLVGGAAGCALALVAIHQILMATNGSTAKQFSKAIMSLAIACGNHLISQAQRDSEGNITSWKFPSSQDGSVSGFAHGIAGPVLAFRRLYHLTNQDSFRLSAESAAKLEDSTYNHDKQCYPQVGTEDGHSGSSWCWGTPGILLSRLVGQGGPKLPCVGVHPSIVDATELSMCCGAAGRLMIAMELEKLNHRLPQNYVDAKVLIMKLAVDGATSFPSGERFSFMRGVTGVAYTILRSINPDLPCVLALGWSDEVALDAQKRAPK